MSMLERRRRLARRHRLAPGTAAADPVEAARSVIGLHATDPASVILAALARLAAPEVTAVERALYEDRALVRMLGMRRTMFSVPTDFAPIIQSACTRAIAVKERRQLLRFIEGGQVADDPAAWLAEVQDAVVRHLRAHGSATANELSTAVPQMRAPLTLPGPGGQQVTQAIGPRVLFLLGADGLIARGRPLGSWTSSLVRWHPIEAWLRNAPAEPPTEQARIELVRRWLGAFGPGTLADLAWWTGWPVGDVKRALAGLEVLEVELDGGTGLVLADDLAPESTVRPFAALLPALDPSVMGWKARDWFLGDHAKALFDRNGNAGPTIWWDGRIVGGWAHRKDGEVAIRLLEDVGADATGAITAAADRLAGSVGKVRVTPRFRTPLEKELAA
ncbi:MAG TPA: winged helix DNA-binding domain-containing protein [Micromonosporaceae bacterium]|nr:winged helix DNA-binding domain-containing protein [Micromonosporaceae bacterium]